MALLHHGWEQRYKENNFSWTKTYLGLSDVDPTSRVEGRDETNTSSSREPERVSVCKPAVLQVSWAIWTL